MKPFSLKLKPAFLCLLAAALFVSCSEDDSVTTATPFVVAFENLSANISDIETSKTLSLLYSETATEQGSFEVSIVSTNAIYGVDFTTEPAAEGSTITLPIEASENGKSIVFNKLNPTLDETVTIELNISAIHYPSSVIQGNTRFLFGNTPALGTGYSPNVGGPNQQNQVYIDLSSEAETVVQRDTWDLGFYAGDEFRVGINGAIYMATAQLESTDIDAISEADVTDLQPQVAVGTFDPDNVAYIDHPDGAITKTAIASISATEAENKVYLVNLGYTVGTDAPEPGSVAVAGSARGWKKIRVLRQGDDYLLQYANLNDTTHQEVVISKNEGYNFTFFSFDTENVVTAEPRADQWDLNFTVFTNIIDGAGSYGFSDGVLHNSKGGVTAYSVETTAFDYDAFSASDVVLNNFEQDQRVIGSTWRDVINDDKVLIDTIFYILKDANGNLYKLKFTSLLNENGERGFPEFKYNLLQ